MIRLLQGLYRPSAPLLAATSWLSILLIALLVAVTPSVMPFATPAYGFGGDEGATQTADGGFVFNPIDSILQMIWGTGMTASDPKREARQGKRIGLQAGHWRYWESPSPFNTQTGGNGGGKTEPEVTLDVARRAAKILEDMGYAVEILPAWFQDGYTADAVVALHTDGADNLEARGFFADRYGDSTVPETDDRFMAALDEEFGKATGLPFKYRSTPGSRYYYGYTKVKPKTPMVLIEMGFLTNEQDREIVVKDPDRAAKGIANGVDRFLLQ